MPAELTSRCPTYHWQRLENQRRKSPVKLIDRDVGQRKLIVVHVCTFLYLCILHVKLIVAF